jgi:hypothetical protein
MAMAMPIAMTMPINHDDKRQQCKTKRKGKQYTLFFRSFVRSSVSFFMLVFPLFSNLRWEVVATSPVVQCLALPVALIAKVGCILSLLQTPRGTNLLRKPHTLQQHRLRGAFVLFERIGLHARHVAQLNLLACEKVCH